MIKFARTRAYHALGGSQISRLVAFYDFIIFVPELWMATVFGFQDEVMNDDLCYENYIPATPSSQG